VPSVRLLSVSPVKGFARAHPERLRLDRDGVAGNTTRDPDTGERDLDALRLIKGYRGLREGKHIDFGVYARVEQPGLVAIGDTAEPL
jgi:uncharacterized protein YcbX